MSKAEIGAGDITVTLGGKALVLKPSLGACIALTTDPGGLFGGENSLYARIARFDFEAMIKVTRQGLDHGALPGEALAEAMYAAGLVNLKEPLEAFMVAVINGGKVPTTAQEKKEGPDPQEVAA